MKKFLTLFFCCAGMYTMHAQIKHFDVTPTRVIKGTTSSNHLDSVKIHLAHPLGTVIGKDSALHIWHFDPDAPASNDVGVDCRGMDVEVLYLATAPFPSQAAAIDSGMMIDANAGTWKRPNYIRLAIEGVALNNWSNQTDKYLGIRFKRNGNWHYGWAKMTIDGLPSFVELKAYGYEQTAGKGIPAGAKGTPITSVGDIHLSDVSIHITNRALKIAGLEGVYNTLITDISGRVVSSATQNGPAEIDLAKLAPGMYIVKIQQGSKATSQKFTLQ